MRVLNIVNVSAKLAAPFLGLFIQNLDGLESLGSNKWQAIGVGLKPNGQHLRSTTAGPVTPSVL